MLKLKIPIDQLKPFTVVIGETPVIANISRQHLESSIAIMAVVSYTIFSK